MELDFDKEIDALLRRMPKSDADMSADNPLFAAHLDADEISAFAENALPEKAKQRLTKHLADCDACRKNLSESILLSSENEAEPVAESEETPLIAPAAVSWYQKLFAFPNLAYAMGALVLAFTGLTAFIILQNLSGGLSSDVASSNTASREKAVAPAAQSAPTMANANSAASSNTAVDSDSAQNTAIMSPQSSPEIPAQNPPAENPAVDRKTSPAESKPEDFSRDEDDASLARAGATPVPTAGANSEQAERENQPRSEISTDAVTSAQVQPAPKIVAAAPPPPPSAPGTKLEEKKESPSKRSSRDLSKSDMKDKSAGKGAGSGGSRQIGGKTFTQRSGIWYDADYRNQPTINVRRGTNEYQKLDSGLRAVGNQLGGVVVVVWKSTAYRIQ